MYEAISKAVDYRGGRTWHVRDSRQSPEMEDFLDLFILLPPFMGFFEVKSQGRKVTNGQRGVVELAARCDRAISAIVRPVPREGETSYDELIAWIESVKETP